MNNSLKTIGVFTFSLCIAAPLLALWQGWAVSMLWNWFVAPMGVPAITILTGAGLTLVCGAIRARNTKSTSDESQTDRFERLAAMVLIPAITVFIGWIIKTFA